MRRRWTRSMAGIIVALCSAFVLVGWGVALPSGAAPASSTTLSLSASATRDYLSVNGRLVDGRNRPVARANVTISLDGSTLGSSTTGSDGSFSANFRITGTSPGTHVVTGRAYPAGLSSDSASVTVTVPGATTAPTTTSPPPKPVPTTTTTAPRPTATRTTTKPTATRTTTSKPTSSKPRSSASRGNSTSITLSAPGSVTQGGVVQLSGVLSVGADVLVGAAVDVSCASGAVVSAPTNSRGAYQAFPQIPLSRVPGLTSCTARFAGGGGFAPASVTHSLRVTKLVIRTPKPTPSTTSASRTPTPTEVYSQPIENTTPTPTPVAVAVVTPPSIMTRVFLIIGGASVALLTVAGIALMFANRTSAGAGTHDRLIDHVN